MELALPEDPDRFASHIDAATHQIVQVQAIGTVVRDDSYPPAKALLGNFEIYPADRLLPSVKEIERRRAAAHPPAGSLMASGD
jgi:branched-chain amino acid transport system substrate-binding protein